MSTVSVNVEGTDEVKSLHPKPEIVLVPNDESKADNQCHGCIFTILSYIAKLWTIILVPFMIIFVLTFDDLSTVYGERVYNTCDGDPNAAWEWDISDGVSRYSTSTKIHYASLQEVCNGGNDEMHFNWRVARMACYQLITIDGWKGLNIAALVLHVVGTLFYFCPMGPKRIQWSQIMYCMSCSCLLGAILWFSLDSPLCTGQGSVLGHSMQLNICIMFVQFFTLFVFIVMRVGQEWFVLSLNI